MCRLQQCDVLSFDDNGKTAFFLNLYNLMVQHAFVSLGVPQSARQRMLFFDAVKYSVGGFTLSLNDIEHGVLRSNVPGAYRVYRQFGACATLRWPRLAPTLPRHTPCVPALRCDSVDSVCACVRACCGVVTAAAAAVAAAAAAMIVT